MERWRALAEQFAREGYRIVLTGGSGDRIKNSDVIESLPESLRDVVFNVAGCSLSEAAWILSHADLTVAVDTGTMHLAGALDVPLVALHGPSSSRRWGSLSKKTVAIDSPMQGCGYLTLGFETRDPCPDCMRQISFEIVRDTCHELLRSGRIENKTPESLPARR